MNLRALLVWALLLSIAVTSAVAAEETLPACCASVSSMRGTIKMTATPAGAERASASGADTAPRVASFVLTFHRNDGQVFVITDHPPLPRVPERGLQVEVKATVVQLNGRDALRVDEVHPARATPAPLAERKFPLRARCAHCGCRLQIDTPQALAEPCAACKCNKTNEECLHY